MEMLVYVGIVIAFIGLGILGIYLKRKFNIKDNEIELLSFILDTLSYINTKIEYKYKDDASVIIYYVIEAVQFVEDFAEDITVEEKKTLVFDKAKQICFDNGIEVDEKLEEIISTSIDYILKYYK